MDSYVSQAICVIGFERDQTVRLKQADAEKAFAKVFGHQSEQTNVPDEFEPTAPRLLFSDAHKQLTISQTAIQLTLGFNRSTRKSGTEILDIYEKNSWDIFRGFDKFLGKNRIRETAAIFSINYPRQEDQSVLHQYLHDRFIKVSQLGDLASINIQIGYRTNDRFFLNFAASVYELRAKEFTPPLLVHRPLTVDVLEIPVVERGYGLKIDINSRPQRLEGNFDEMQDPKPLLKKMRRAVEADAAEFLGFTSAHAGEERK